MRKQTPRPIGAPPRKPDRTGYESEARPPDFARHPGKWIPRDCNVAPRERSGLAVALFWLGYPLAVVWGVALVHWLFPGVCP